MKDNYFISERGEREGERGHVVRSNNLASQFNTFCSLPHFQFKTQSFGNKTRVKRSNSNVLTGGGRCFEEHLTIILAVFVIIVNYSLK